MDPLPFLSQCLEVSSIEFELSLTYVLNLFFKERFKKVLNGCDAITGFTCGDYWTLSEWFACIGVEMK